MFVPTYDCARTRLRRGRRRELVGRCERHVLRRVLRRVRRRRRSRPHAFPRRRSHFSTCASCSDASCGHGTRVAPLFFNAWSTNSREKASLVDDEGLKRAQSSYVAKSTFLLILITHLYDAHPRRVVSRLIVINVARRERLPKRRQKPRARSLCVRHANLGKHP